LTDLPVAEVDPNIRIVPYSKSPLRQMAQGVVDSKQPGCPIVFAAVSKRVSANVNQYFLRKHVVPCVQRTYSDSNYVFHQDPIPAQTARNTKELLKGILNPGGLATYLPDLNPLDFPSGTYCRRKSK
jgi:hypothetical protein